MTYIHEYEIKGPMGPDFIKVEYCFSSVTSAVKVVDMWVNGKEHQVSWMSYKGRDMLMARLEKDLEDRLCGTTLDDSSPESFGLETFDDDSAIEPFMRSLMADEEAAELALEA